MKNKTWLTFIRIVGVVIMLIAFAVMPEEYPWYYEVLLYNVGLVMVLVSNPAKFRKMLTTIFSLGSVRAKN